MARLLPAELSDQLILDLYLQGCEVSSEATERPTSSPLPNPDRVGTDDEIDEVARLQAEAIAHRFLMTAVGAILIIVAAAVVYRVHFLDNPIAVAAAFVLCAASVFAFGFLLPSVLPTAPVNADGGLPAVLSAAVPQRSRLSKATPAEPPANCGRLSSNDQSEERYGSLHRASVEPLA